MSTTCPRCQSAIETNSRFCTTCGAVLAAPEPDSQPPLPGQEGPSWQYGQYGQYSQQPQQYGQQPQQSQVPPWASAGGAPYQQQGSNPANPAAGGSLGFGGRNDALAKKIITYVVAGIVITLALLVLLGLLAAFIAPLRWLFCIFLFVVILVPLILYSTIRSYIRRTVGRLWWF